MLVRGVVCVCECVLGSAALAYARARRSTGEFCFLPWGYTINSVRDVSKSGVPDVFFTPAARRARRPGRPAKLSMPLPAFVEALERCISELSATVSHTSTIWADHCESPGDKTRFQVRLARQKGLAR